MKKIFLTGLIVALFASCEGNLESINVDPKQPESADPAHLFSYAQFNLARQLGNADYNHNVSRFWANYATQTTYIQEASYNAADRDIGGNIFDNIYTETLFELKTAKEIIEAQEVGAAELAVKNNKLAMIQVMEVYCYQYLVDNFGDVPFTEALDINNVTPAYDDDEFVYTSIISMLEAAVGMLTPSAGAGSFASNDLIYGGDVSSWVKFALTLHLKLGTRISKSHPTLASQVINTAFNGGVFDSASDNAVFNYTGTSPYVNPVYDYFVIDARNTDFVATSSFLALLESLNDPRVNAFYDDNVPGGMIGGTYGAEGNAYSELTHLNPSYTDDAVAPTVIMDYTLALFDLAEAVERGFIAGDAEMYYNEGVKASFASLGLSSADADAYLVDNAYDSASWDQSIGIQKYIASFHSAHEAWTEARRLGIPTLAVAASNGVANPKRMIYPIDEPLVNTTNYNAAASNMGSDSTTSAIFWDVD